MSDYQLEDTVYLPFTTRAFATGIPTALVSGTVEIYEDASTTQITAAETLTVSLDGVVGFNMIAVVATAANGFGAGQSYTAILSVGTVGGVSVVGEVVGHFTLDMSAAAKDLANATDGLGALKSLIDTVDTVVDAIKVVTDKFAFTVANQVDSNSLSVSGTAQTANDNGADINTILSRIIGTLAAGTHNPASAAQIAVLSDWINGGRLDLIIDLINAATAGLAGAAMRGTDGANTTVPDAAGTAPTAVEIRQEMDTNSVDLNSILANQTTIAGLITALNDLSAAQVNAEVDTALADYDGPTNAEMEARTPTAAQLAYIVSNAADGPPVTFTGGTTTTAILGNVDGAAASSVDDFYNGRILVFNAGTLNEQVTDITDYDGATLTATITAVTTAVTAAHTANMK